jgi:pimeloyl-ACP methyl ester carboxylesterase
LEINELYLVGSSLGGWLSWEYALHYPERVRRLILIAAAGFLDDKSIPLPFKMARTPFVNRVIKYTISRSVLESFVREVYYNQSKITPQLLERYYDLFAREGNPEAFFLFVNQRFIDNTLHLKKLKTPTLILWGKEDKWLPVENAHRFHHLIEANEMIIYEQTGHLPMEEIPHDSLEDLLAFLNKDIDNQSSNFGQMAQNWEAQA